jgi:hypothetical protein
MPGVLRILAGRGVWAGVVGLACSAPAAAQPPDDPIAVSNRLTEPWVAPGVRLTALEAPWLVPTPEPKPVEPQTNSPANPPGKALLQRIVSRGTTDGVPAAAPASAPVVWSAPARQLITPIFPTSARPMVPCEPIVLQPAVAPLVEPPLPPPRVLSPEDGQHQSAAPLAPPAPPTQRQVVIATAANDELPARTATTIRFLDEPPPPPVADDTTLMAVIRRGGAATGSAADIRTVVERVCRGKVVTCRTEVAGERQVRVMLTVHSTDDWQRLYDRMQNRPELGEYGLLFEVRVEK